MTLFKKPTSIKNWLVGLLQASGVFLYIVFIAYFMTQTSAVFTGKTGSQTVMGTIMLLIFSVSALVCGLIALGHPIKVGLDKRLKEAVDMVLWTIAFLAIYALLTILGFYLA